MAGRRSGGPEVGGPGVANPRMTAKPSGQPRCHDPHDRRHGRNRHNGHNCYLGRLLERPARRDGSQIPSTGAKIEPIWVQFPLLVAIAANFCLGSRPKRVSAPKNA